MSDYISREAVLSSRSVIEVYDANEDIVDWGVSFDTIKAIPAADVAPVVHGEWGEWEYGAGHYCTVCGKDSLCDGVEEEVLSNFCPNCGAKMDGGNKYETY